MSGQAASPSKLQTMHPEPGTLHRPWFREPMLWLVIAIPLATVVAGIITMMIAASTSDRGLDVPHLPKGPPMARSAEPVQPGDADVRANTKD